MVVYVVVADEKAEAVFSTRELAEAAVVEMRRTEGYESIRDVAEHVIDEKAGHGGRTVYHAHVDAAGIVLASWALLQWVAAGHRRSAASPQGTYAHGESAESPEDAERLAREALEDPIARDVH